MENNNVKVQATPSHCTVQNENIERIVLPKSPDFACCILDKNPGIVYIRVAKDEFISLDLINKTKCEVKSSWIRNANHVKIIRNLHDNIEDIEKGKIPKRAIINKQIDLFRKAVLPTFNKVSLSQIKNRAQTFLEVLGIEGGEYFVNKLGANYLKFIYEEPFERAYVYSKTLGENIDYIEKFYNYMHANNEYVYNEFVTMFRFLCESIPEFLDEYVVRDLEYLYDELLYIDEVNYTYERNYNLLNKMVYRYLHKRRLHKLNENVKSISEIDTNEEAQLVVSFTDEEDITRTVTLNEVKVNTDYIKDNMLSINFDRDDMDMLLNLIPNEYNKACDVELNDIPNSVRVSMQIRDVSDDYLCYTEVELDFSKVHLFQYCPKTKALLAKEDIDKELYVPVLKNEN
ncbi:hypothetical protein [Paraclostridium bifermentans]|uniref:hypothetical protein n=1 Tax=Paraclostridium bifermentans TaxID=1490 RepID=UPI00374E9BDA